MSKPHYYTRYTPRRKDPENDPFDQLMVYVPKSLAHILKAKSDELELPISRLICYALDNELDVETPFNYPCPLPSSPYAPFAYAEEANKILTYLGKFPSGTGRDTLMLCRRDIGVFSKAVFMLAYRELLETNAIEEFIPRRTKFRYAKDYFYVRATEMDPKSLKKNRYKKIEGESTKYDLGTRTAKHIQAQREEDDNEGYDDEEV